MTAAPPPPGPLVCVVTPFYNTARYLRECIESVLAQTYGNFVYLLVDNLSTDDGYEIASSYAARDPRIRVYRNPAHVGQMINYNGALRLVPPRAAYVKLVQADDLLLPECLARMVAVGEKHPGASIISSYYRKGADVLGGGLPVASTAVPGRDACRLHLLDGRFLFGSPSTVMYRADLVRARDPFYSETSQHADTELCYEALEHGELGFVHQVLSCLRVEAGSLTGGWARFNWQLLGFYLLVRRYGERYLTSTELAAVSRRVRQEYLVYLGESRLYGRAPGFWEHHRRALASIGESLPSAVELAPYLALASARALVHPRWALNQWRAGRERLGEHVRLAQ